MEFEEVTIVHSKLSASPPDVLPASVQQQEPRIPATKRTAGLFVSVWSPAHDTTIAVYNSSFHTESHKSCFDSHLPTSTWCLSFQFLKICCREVSKNSQIPICAM